MAVVQVVADRVGLGNIMLDITILAVGSIKDKNYLALGNEYQKRLKPYARLEIVELASVSFSASNQEKAKGAEGKAIQDYLTKRSASNRPGAVFLLAERGREYSSPELAAWLEKEGSVILVVGGTLGFSADLYERYPQLSLSALTFPHELARVILLEQIYRATTIINGKDYHY